MSERLLWDKDGGDWPNGAYSRFVAAAGFTWHIQKMGTGPVVLLAHGLGASTHSWRKFAPLLSAHFTVVGFDLPGHAFTDLPKARRMAPPAMAEAVGELLGVIEAVPDYAIGHSAGASLLARMCLDKVIAPKLLVSLNGALLPFGGFGQIFLPLAKLLFGAPFDSAPKLFARLAGDRAAIVRLLRSTGSVIDIEGIEFYARLYANPSHIEGMLAMMANWDLQELRRDLPGLKTPLVLVAGGKDRTVPEEQAFRVRDLVAASKVVRLRQLGHLAHEERPQDVAELVLRLTHAATAS